MLTTVYEISGLPVGIGLAALATAIMWWWLHRRAVLTVPRVVVGAVACVYGAGVIANTLLPIYIGKASYHPSWSSFLNLVPFTNTEPFDMLQNVLVFAPLGVLLPLLRRVSSVRRVLLSGFLLSLTMEVLQYVNALTGHGGHVADVNDLLANTAGAVVEYSLFWLARRQPAIERLFAAATWPGPVREPTPVERTVEELRTE